MGRGVRSINLVRVCLVTGLVPFFATIEDRGPNSRETQATGHNGSRAVSRVESLGHFGFTERTKLQLARSPLNAAERFGAARTDDEPRSMLASHRVRVSLYDYPVGADQT
jgi:hypothetical protein